MEKTNLWKILGLKENPFPRMGVPTSSKVEFAAPPGSRLKRENLKAWVLDFIKEEEPAAHIFYGVYGKGKTRLRREIQNIMKNAANDIEIHTEHFNENASLSKIIESTDYTKDVLLLMDEVQGLQKAVNENPQIIKNFKRELRNFLELELDVKKQEELKNVKLFLFVPQV